VVIRLSSTSDPASVSPFMGQGCQCNCARKCARLRAAGSLFASNVMDLHGSAPTATWLATTDAPESAGRLLSNKSSRTGSVSDQSGSYTYFASPRPARSLLQRVLHRSSRHVFRHDPATTVIAHVGVILWQVDDHHFEVATFRSYAPSFFDAGRNSASLDPFPSRAMRF